MAVIRIPAFGGMIPRLGSRLLPDTAAVEAVNCKLWSKEARPWNALLTANEPSKTGTIKSIYLFGTSPQYWLHWNEDVDVARAPIAGDTTERTYFTGTDAPRVTNATLVNTGAGTDYPKDSYLLGVPIPAAAITAALGAGGSGTPRAVRYVYTYVTGMGEEGPPAAASNEVTALPGQTVNLSGMSVAPAGDYNITAKRIYRLNTGSSDSVYQFLAEVAIGTTTYADSTLDQNLGEALETAAWIAPPSGMKGIIALPNGILAGFVDNIVCFCEPYYPHAWPVAYQVTLDFPIVAIGAYGTSVVAATVANPYVIYGSTPGAMQASKIPEFHGCVSKRGLVSLRSGVVFPTSNGLVLVNNPNAATKITEAIMSRDEWQALYPDTIVAAVHDGRYFAWYETGLVNGVMTGGGFVLDPDNIGAGITKLNFLARAAHTDHETGKLYVLTDSSGTNLIRQWEGSTSKLDLDWKSKPFVLREPVNMAFARVSADFSQNLTADESAACESERSTALSTNQATIDAGDILGAVGDAPIGEYELAGDNLVDVPSCDPSQSMAFTLYAADEQGVMVERLSKTITSNRAFSLPRGYESTEFQVRAVGQIPIKEIALATSEEELHG